MLKLIRQNYTFFLPYAILLVLIGSLLHQLDRTMLMHWINQRNHPWADLFFYAFTDIGDGLFAFGLALGLLFVRYRWALLAGLCFLVSGEITQLLKHAVFSDELRPSAFYEHSGWAFHTVTGLDLHRNNSFPSGHTTTVFAVFCFLTLIVKNKNWGWLFISLATLAAYSRVYLFQHFVADVYVGSFIGTFTTVLIFYGFDIYWQSHPYHWLDKHIQVARK
ncbi:MAG: phosphatase PAP2 family protein [Siphonobacter sp.]